MKFVYSQYTHAHTYDQIVETKTKNEEIRWIVDFVCKLENWLNGNKRKVVCDLSTK